MCGRFALRYPTTPKLADVFLLESVPDLSPRYNIAPSQEVLVVRAGNKTEDREGVFCRWGLVPHWARDEKIGSRMINARAETVFEKPAFRTAARHRRCLIPADAFYEWKKTTRGKEPYAFTRKDDGLFAFAGLWERWDPPDGGKSVSSCTILTRPANAVVALVHNRMPVVLSRDAYAQWLDPTIRKPEAIAPLLDRPGPELRSFPVSSRVNSPANDDPKIFEE